MKSLRILIPIVLLSALAAAVLWWLPDEEKPKWVMAKVDQGAIVQRVAANGTLNPVELVNVGTQISGTVLKLHVDFNQPVKAGQLLAELDPAILEAQIRQSEANLASARAVLNNAELALKRNENLKSRGFVSDGALDGLRKDVETARAQVAQIEAQISRDRTNLGYSKVRSPIDGIVVNRGIDVGQTVAASFQTPTLFQIARDLRRMQIDTSVSEADVGPIQSGQPVRFTVDAFREQDFTAKVRMVRLNPTTQQNVVTYNVVINVDNKDGILLPGMTAQVSIVTNRKERVLRVPSAALRFRPPETDAAAAAAAAPPEKGRRASAQVPRVHVIGESGALTPKEIKVGITDGRFTEVLEGLAEGDEVVVRAVAAPTNNQTSGFRFRMF
ncbi:MAG: efflux RND transporter periplasmic adaptor subunit [Betaproteobacteria bacterium]|jgi:HlyD family secretion protein|nr:efflux RND transporter periplasmic adaptor subunit [Betaproteobacteria bacterium]